ncbi:MAG: lipid A biosynthesis lauroyl acyltransferase [Xanthomonadales bacterium]|nr:lipid A biosynthesis lauroyl acyltransferase [Xanthomonadales bacterium]
MSTATRPPLTPRNWAGWLAVGLLWLLGKTPQRLAVALSVPVGALLSRLLARRRRIAARNIERCFPELNPVRRAVLLRDHFRSLARMVFEVAWSWSAASDRLRKMGHIEGSEHVLGPLSRGRGVLLITAHFTCLEIGGRLTSWVLPAAAAMYRPLRNPVMEWYQNRSRAKYTGMINQKDLRKAARFLKNGGALWYAPDQDFGAARSVFVPFFGIRTATLKTTEHLVRLTGCAVVPMFPGYDAERRVYSVTFYPALDNFPSGDMVEDLGRISAVTEQHARKFPDQYWWIHRRFKTRPEGEPAFYD